MSFGFMQKAPAVLNYLCRFLAGAVLTAGALEIALSCEGNLYVVGAVALLSACALEAVLPTHFLLDPKWGLYLMVFAIAVTLVVAMATRVPLCAPDPADVGGRSTGGDGR